MRPTPWSTVVYEIQSRRRRQGLAFVGGLNGAPRRSSNGRPRLASCAHISKRTCPQRSVQCDLRVPGTPNHPLDEGPAYRRSPIHSSESGRELTPADGTHTKGEGGKQLRGIIRGSKRARPDGLTLSTHVRTRRGYQITSRISVHADLQYSVYRHGPRP